ncbi:MAG: hypothetical protein ACYCSN_13485 [Acidobacteriaceae bacterium]
MTANDRWNFGSGVFVAQGLSQQIVTTGDGSPLAALSKLSPKPSAAAVKFGGDWGGLWGTPQTWGQLSPKSAAPPPVPIVPYLYLLPQHIDAYPAMIGGLFADGYPAVTLDVEMKWAGHEAELSQLLDQLNLADNLIGLCGYAWYEGWPDRGARMAVALEGKDIVYIPMAYAGVGWSCPYTSATPMSYIKNEVGMVATEQPKAYIFDAEAVDAGWSNQVSARPSWYWQESTLTAARWRLIQYQRQPSQPSDASSKVVLEKVRQKLIDLSNQLDDVATLAGKA